MKKASLTPTVLNPRRHPRIPHEYTYKDKEDLLKRIKDKEDLLKKRSILLPVIII